MRGISRIRPVRKQVWWIFNPHGASHHGGTWERQIPTVGKVLNSLLRQQQLDDEGLQTPFVKLRVSSMEDP